MRIKHEGSYGSGKETSFLLLSSLQVEATWRVSGGRKPNRLLIVKRLFSQLRAPQSKSERQGNLKVMAPVQVTGDGSFH